MTSFQYTLQATAVMGIHTFYRIGIWLPVIVPGVVVGTVEALNVHPTGLFGRKILQVLAISLLYGGVPYTGLAVWATWWIGGRSEAEIRHLMLRAPVLFAGVFAVTALTLGLSVGQIRLLIATAAAGAVMAIPLGYGYVALVLFCRRFLSSAINAG